MDIHISAMIATAVERTATRIRKEFAEKQPITKTWLKTSEAAEYLSCDTDWLEKLRREGGGPKFYQRAARMVRYRITDLDKWMLASGQDGQS